MRPRDLVSCLAVVLVLGLFQWGCQQTSSGPSTAPSGRPLLLSGIIFETTPNGRRPIESGTVEYAVDGPGPIGGRTTWNDARGRYSIEVPGGALVYVTAFGSRFTEFNQVCAATMVMAESATLDIELVRPGQAVSNRRSPTLSGVIYRTDAGGGRHSYANNFVEYKAINFERVVYTMTDANGRFEFCNLPLGHGSVTVVDCNDGSYSYGLPIDLSGDGILDWDITSRVKSCPDDQ